MNLIFDQRDHPVNPARGVFGKAAYTFYRTGLGSDRNWDSFQLEGRAYQPLSRNRRQGVALWGLAWLTPSGQPPYFDLPSVGWDTYGRTARGYRSGRFRGRDWKSEDRAKLSLLELPSTPNVPVDIRRAFHIFWGAHSETTFQTIKGNGKFTHQDVKAGWQSIEEYVTYMNGPKLFGAVDHTFTWSRRMTKNPRRMTKDAIKAAAHDEGGRRLRSVRRDDDRLSTRF